jgi:2-keto-4-pentenoate hydratase/2-oxohepta-3-ene-1,7-dioic acid hydratase in catechol pathway
LTPNASGRGGTGRGRTPQEFMHPGETVTVGMTGVGYLTNPLEAGWAEPPAG